MHHEWGTGLLLYAVTLAWGAAALMTLKYLLTAGVVGLIAATARRGEAAGRVALARPAGVGHGVYWPHHPRAQLLSLLFIALLLWMLSGDERSKRWWVVGWLAAYLLWLNLHAGFVVGAVLLAAYWLEAVLRRRALQPHLLAAGLAMILLLPANPYGLDYPRYLGRALTMPRPQITEWWPLWASPPLFGRIWAGAAGDPLRRDVAGIARADRAAPGGPVCPGGVVPCAAPARSSR